MIFHIYSLTDPRSMQVFYVGQTTNPKDCLSTHIAVSKLPGKDGDGRAIKARVREIIQAGFRPTMSILETTPDKAQEKHWIQHCLFLGLPLLNKAHALNRTREELNAMQRVCAARHRAKRKAETGYTKGKTRTKAPI
jgi:hypothetical protein